MDTKFNAAARHKRAKQQQKFKNDGEPDFILAFAQAQLCAAIRTALDTSADVPIASIASTSNTQVASPSALKKTVSTKDVLLNDKVINNGLKPAAQKGLLLYAQNKGECAAFETQFEALSETLSEKIAFDQIPFTAAFYGKLDLKSLKGQYDYVISQLSFDWLDASEFIQQVQALIKPGGKLWFSLFGVQTATQLQSILADIESVHQTKFKHFNDFYDMQEVGDALLSIGLVNVVLDSSSIALEYPAFDVLLDDASAVFGLNLNPERRNCLTPKKILSALNRAIDSEIKQKGVFKETVEVVTVYAEQQAYAPKDNKPTIPVRVQAK